MSDLPNPESSRNGQLAQLSWLQSCTGEWVYFLENNTNESNALDKIVQDYIWLVCQEKTTHKVGGYRIENHVIETLIEQIAAVKQVVVFGVPHEHKGNGIYVYAQLNGAAIDLSVLSRAISAKLVGCLGDFSEPEVIKFVDELPGISNKKLCRQILKSQAMNIHCAA
ncbi:AMP-binding enzyme [Cognaticolwellia mytili]|uniref:AMP-binding enzyme n=1 Tax=Cognaticolwellia mytili TaxID=1888913 RepID=UPI000A171D93|nr:acyl-CoA synthetase [Cognaticolwellia mytili]